MSRSTQLLLDKFAVSISVVCAIHCVLLPVFLVMFPAISAMAFLADESFHFALLWIILPTSSIAIFLGCRDHKDYRVLMLSSLGFALLVGAVIFGHDFLDELGEKIMTLVGAAVLSIAHIRNFMLCRNQVCEH